ncbi:glycoside hydrolase family 53 protein [Aplosporella prunicola CBS 121167]|uniref:Arabinogalactan endo-beta-1,4-galactanase n=1 Tax=Aplosporella prunicola CBS 121167 TaxID=1176127 RepID=A0A6A6BK93_9PEZI|nr:glycoside hydrolase family 53 protein [Aplosporella prunicola CBS 121167]KAF2143755.1 glycoside hydrolase family 53 protein [Aplosporella prunicola CBS 121167]
MAALSGTAAAWSQGHDLSSVKAMEDEQGAHWINASGQETQIEEILSDGGMDSVRLRLWTGQQYGLDYTLELAKRFSKAGQKIYLDLHFSDTWADAGNQVVPSAWSTSSIDDLAAQTRKYVTETLQSFSDAGVELEILSLGNEVTGGMLYPLGQIENDDFSGFATLWAAARAGVDDAVSNGVTKPKIMIHLDNGWKEETLTWWFDGVFNTGTVTSDMVDTLGLSFYPFYGTGATLDALKSSMNTLATKYSKEIVVAETDWPVACDGVELSEDIPVSAEGQKEWVSSIIENVKALPSNLGGGVFYWEPAFINNTGLGSKCDSAILFDVNWDNWPNTQATALDSVSMFS